MISFFCIGSLYAEDLSVAATASFDKAEITIGEKVKYTVTIDMPKDTIIEFPVIDSMLTEAGFAIRDFGEDKPVKLSKSQSRIKYWYVLDIYVVGSYTIPAVGLQYTLPNGAKGSIETKEVFLEVKSVVNEGENSEDIHDIKSPVDMPFSYKKFILIGLVVILVLLGIMGAYYYIHRKHITENMNQSIPLHIIALRDLERLRAMSLETEPMIKEYYGGVSGVVRHYIESRFDLHAPEMTTEEFLKTLTGNAVLCKEHKSLLRDFLKHCDMVKFAKYGPTKGEIEDVYCSAEKFIKETIPQIDDIERKQEDKCKE